LEEWTTKTLCNKVFFRARKVLSVWLVSQDRKVKTFSTPFDRNLHHAAAPRVIVLANTVASSTKEKVKAKLFQRLGGKMEQACKNIALGIKSRDIVPLKDSVRSCSTLRHSLESFSASSAQLADWLQMGRVTRAFATS
jgi:hypothetical protein